MGFLYIGYQRGLLQIDDQRGLLQIDDQRGVLMIDEQRGFFRQKAPLVCFINRRLKKSSLSGRSFGKKDQISLLQMED